MMDGDDPGLVLREMFIAAVAEALPLRCLAGRLPQPPAGRTIVVGAGKAAAAMARTVEKEWAGPLEGLVVTRYGHGADCERIEVIEAAHPVPDAAGRAAAGRILDAVSGLGHDDLVIALISGGASALLAWPGEGLSLGDKQAVNSALLKCGAPIGEMNTVRKHLSAIKGGRLARAACPGRVATFAISDVPGDDPAVIGSGPTVPDASSAADARAIIAKYALDVPGAVTAFLDRPEAETPKAGDPVFERASVEVVATPGQSLKAAARTAVAAGWTPVILGDAIEGVAREVAQAHAGVVRERLAAQSRGAPPLVLISGGETTVTVRGRGRGGRNCEYLLALAIALDGLGGVHAIACDTDGIDGSEDNAGAQLGPDTRARARVLGIDAGAALADNDGYGFFSALDALVMTGPTRTNVNDFRAIVIGCGG